MKKYEYLERYNISSILPLAEFKKQVYPIQKKYKIIQITLLVSGEIFLVSGFILGYFALKFDLKYLGHSLQEIGMWIGVAALLIWGLFCLGVAYEIFKKINWRTKYQFIQDELVKLGSAPIYNQMLKSFPELVGLEAKFFNWI